MNFDMANAMMIYGNPRPEIEPRSRRILENLVTILPFQDITTCLNDRNRPDFIRDTDGRWAQLYWNRNSNIAGVDIERLAQISLVWEIVFAYGYLHEFMRDGQMKFFQYPAHISDRRPVSEYGKSWDK